MIRHTILVGLFFFVSILLHHSALAQFTSTECGTTKTCLTLPDNCSPSESTCTFFSWSWNGTFFEMELSGGAGGGSTYAAVGFAVDEQMKDADTYYCTGSGLVNAVIGAEKTAPTVVASQTGLSSVSSATTNGVAQCNFVRAPIITKTTTAGPTNFDLTARQYWILMAQGAAPGGIPSYHSSSRRFSTTAVDMTATPTVATTAATTSTAATTTAAQAEGCGTTKGCFQHTSGCSETSADCIYFTWAYNEAENNFLMTISGGTGGGSTYAAVAFGQVDGMQDADMYYCTGSSLGSAVITANQQGPTILDITTETGITLIQAANTNGVAKCTFTRAASITKTISSGPKDFDLTTEMYYVLLARGAASSTGVSYHGGSNRAISSATLDLRTNTGAAASGADIFEKTHGSLMIVAWMVLVNVGAMIARHFKPLWQGTNPGGEKLWFQLHRLLMILALLCTMTAFIIIFVHVGGYASHIPAHAILGIIIMALTLLNPILAVFRPHPNTPNRPIFNWVHYLVGTSVRILAIANLFQGVIAMDELSSWKVPVMGGFVGFLVLMELIMEYLSYRYGHHVWYKGNTKPKEETTRDSDMQMEEPKVRSVRGQTAKTTVLIITTIGLTGFAIAFFVDIGNA